MSYFIQPSIFFPIIVSMEGKSILLLLSFLTTFQMLFISLFLVTTRKGKRRSNRLLGFIFFLFAWNFGDITIQVGDRLIDLGLFQVVDDLFILLYGPLFYLYVQTVIYRDYRMPSRYWLHLMPYFLFTTLLLFSRTNIGADAPASIVSQFIGVAIYLHVLTYISFGFKSLLHYRSVIKNQFSKIEEINLNWLQFTLTSMVVISIISMIHNMFFLSGLVYIHCVSIFFLLIFMLYFVSRVIFKALHQPEIFAGIDTVEVEKYSQSKLSETEIAKIKEQLIVLLENEKVYRIPELTVQDLADRLSVSSKIISQVINGAFGRNFFDLINSYRVIEAKEVLIQPGEKRSILEILFYVGFNTKSSFNTAFKKETGLTPSQFRQKRY